MSSGHLLWECALQICPQQYLTGTKAFISKFSNSEYTMIYRKHVPNKIYDTFLKDFDDLDRLRVDATALLILIVSVVPFVVAVCDNLGIAEYSMVYKSMVKSYFSFLRK